MTALLAALALAVALAALWLAFRARSIARNSEGVARAGLTRAAHAEAAATTALTRMHTAGDPDATRYMPAIGKAAGQ